MKKTLKYIYVGIVLLMLLLPGATALFFPAETRAFIDNRTKASLPEFDVTNLDPFPLKFEDYLSDNFPYRNTTIFFKNLVWMRYLEKSPVPDRVTVGKNGWLYTGENHLDFVTGATAFPDSVITILIEELNRRYDFCKEHGAEFRLVIIPDKASVYPEFLPMKYRLAETGSPAQKLIAHSKNNCRVPILYLYDSLAVQKANTKLYYKSDSHWNETGCYYSYRAIIRWLNPDIKHEQLYPLPAAADTSSVYAGDYSKIIAQEEYWNDTVRFLAKPDAKRVFPGVKVNYPCDTGIFPYCYDYENVWLNSDTTLPRILVIRDSYTNPFMQSLIGLHYSKSVFIWDYWQYKLNADIILNEKPDVVVCLMTETLLENVMMFSSGKAE